MTKFQSPNRNQYEIKIRNKKFWLLKIGIYLVIGAWDLVILIYSPSLSPTFRPADWENSIGPTFSPLSTLNLPTAMIPP